MRVLFLSPDFLWPADRGLRVRALSQLRVLAAIDTVTQITLVSLSDAGVPPEHLRALEEAVPKLRVETPIVRPARMRSSWRSMLRFLRLRLVHREPYLVAQADSPRVRSLLRSVTRRERYDVVYLGYIGMAAYLDDARTLAPRARVVLEEHNVEWRIFDRLADGLRLPMRQAVRWEAHSLARFERDVLREVDGVIAISDADAAGLRDLSGVDPVVVRPFIEPGVARVEATAGPRLGYIGHLGWQPNAQGLDWFFREVWPLVRRRVPDAALTVAGPGLSRGPDGALAVPPLWRQPGVRVVGFVEDLEDVYREAIAMVAPVHGGSGVRMKLLETMSAGMATATTRDGAAGLGIVGGREVLIADEPEQFAENVIRLMSDGDLRARLRAGGYAFLDAHHSQRAAVDAVRRALAIA